MKFYACFIEEKKEEENFLMKFTCKKIRNPSFLVPISKMRTHSYVKKKCRSQLSSQALKVP